MPNPDSPKPSPRLLITAGPTHEAIDAVRFIGNRSSGRMGMALAAAAHSAGWEVTLLLGPAGSAQVPPGVVVHRFTSCEDLRRLLAEQMPAADVLIMAAAVADYRPVGGASEKKLPRGAGRMTLELESTPDLLAECAAKRRPGQLLIGFALEEPAALLVRGGEKLRRKGVDAIVANPLKTMDAGEIDAVLITPGAEPQRPGVMSKGDFAKWLIGWIAEQR